LESEPIAGLSEKILSKKLNATSDNTFNITPPLLNDKKTLKYSPPAFPDCKLSLDEAGENEYYGKLKYLLKLRDLNMKENQNSEIVNFVSHGLEFPKNKILEVMDMLFEQGMTIPFITRYRKEATGGMNEVDIQQIRDTANEYTEREKRKEFVLESLKKQDITDPVLLQKIKDAQTLNIIEDLYSPYKSKTKSKAQIAKEAGLEPFANHLLTSTQTTEQLNTMALDFVNSKSKIENIEDVFKGASDIITERMAHDTHIKEILRDLFWKDAIIKSSKRKGADKIEESEKFKDYFEFEQKISEIKEGKNSHRFLAMRRGMVLKVLKIEVSFDEERATRFIKTKFNIEDNLGAIDLLNRCTKRAYTNYILSSLDLEVKSALKKSADVQAINIFSKNLKDLLLSPYLGSVRVLGVDPGVRTGCKIAVVDKTGELLEETIIYPHHSQKKVVEAKEMLEKLIFKFSIGHIAIGNGTYGRETLKFIDENIEQVQAKTTKALMISEAGASIYSTSEIARKEFPDFDPTVRGAISIARRFQDPLAELVKIDPKSIGVGQYQHDVNQTQLKTSLNDVVESCVNYCGVDLNSASAPLLAHISGIGPTVAEGIVKTREKIQGFKSRKDLLNTPRFGQKVFDLAAGFLRIYNGENPLDATFIHPERYDTITSWCRKHKIPLEQLVTESQYIKKLENDKMMIQELGEFTHQDIIKALLSPSQDPRTIFKSTEFRKDIKNIEDLKKDEYYPGVVTNVTQFGAFIDIGIKENGLAHISQLANRFVKDPMEVIKVGQNVKAKIIDIDKKRKRISLSLK
jgi:protein Tex